MPYRFASRLDDVGLSMIRQIMLKAENCVNLGIGEPDFFALKIVRQEAHRVLDEEKVGYSPTAGLADLCEEIRRYHGSFPDHSACVTNGSQEALFDLLFALIEEGDEVLVPNPGFVAYPIVVSLAGGVPVEYPLRRENNFHLTKGDIAPLVSGRTRAIILVSPSNPTGQCLTLEQLQFVTRVAEERNLVVISDEIYREIYYTEEKPPTIADVTDRAVILSGVSKMASMTGWRIGWACGPEEIIEKLTVMHQYNSSSASTLAQRAALKVFTQEGRVAVGRQRRLLEVNCNLVCSWVERELGRPYVRPQGAFYLMLSVEDLKRDSFAVSLELLKDGVATIPGSAFGSEGEGFLRLSFACERGKIAEGMARLKKGLERLSGKG
ncbi:pyridoxal phosphate-dependent aminotransferase [Acidobacteria bacterium AH-259-L09]|nr:pyridoxal phosphate-dependent aminotransferase [Acidobacteria bacterium AH-259-L09]